jgi:hypothetical protein
MHKLRIGLAILLVLAVSAQAETTAHRIAKETTPGHKLPRLSIAALCAQLTQDEVSTVVGQHFVRQPEKEKLSSACSYGDRKETGALKTRYFSLANSILSATAWRHFIEAEADGKVVIRDGLLISHLRRDKFATDSVWFQDRQGHALELSVNAGISEEQAVALAKAALD